MASGSTLINEVELIEGDALAEWRREFDQQTRGAAVSVKLLKLAEGEVVKVKIPISTTTALVGKWGRKVGWFNPLGLLYKPLVGTAAKGHILFTVEDNLVQPGSSDRVVWENPKGPQPISHAYWALAGSFPAFALGEDRFSLYYSVSGATLNQGATFGQLVVSNTLHQSHSAPYPTPLSTCHGSIVPGQPGKAKFIVERTATRLEFDDDKPISSLVPSGTRRTAVVGNTVLPRLGGGGRSGSTQRSPGLIRGGSGGGAGGRQARSLPHSNMAGLSGAEGPPLSAAGPGDFGGRGRGDGLPRRSRARGTGPTQTTSGTSTPAQQEQGAEEVQEGHSRHLMWDYGEANLGSSGD